eukprot:5707408-Alexandrium_andersonii.AAC.1
MSAAGQPASSSTRVHRQPVSALGCSAGAAAGATWLRGCPRCHRKWPHGPRPDAYWRLPRECLLSPRATR